MRRITDQVEEFQDRGILVMPGALSDGEVAVLDSAVRAVATCKGPHVTCEPNGSVHVVYGVHLQDARFAALVCHPSLVDPARALLGQDFFVHQTRLNLKQPGGSLVAWHQDFATYHHVDGIPDDRGLVIGVLLDEVGPANAPVIVLPGSQRHGILAEARIDTTVPDHGGAARWRFDIRPDTLARLVQECGTEVVTGPAGTVFFMHGSLVHGSSVNILPTRRAIAYVNVSAVDNRGTTFARPIYLAARDFTPVVAQDDDCLEKLAG